ncbi:MAG: hypothetical protein D6816_18190 [Bacteroidetes bacterium]|nr:MAG: hypothetical protein D6816_18190 [Bacteroidota bacterium]
MKDNASTQKGFSLIEAMVAMLVAMIVLLAIVMFSISVVRNDNVALGRSTGVSQAVGLLEEWIARHQVPGAQVSVGNLQYNVYAQTGVPANLSSSLPAGQRPEGKYLDVKWVEHGRQHEIDVYLLEPAP